MSLLHPDPDALLHDTADSTDIAMHCRELSKPMRRIEVHYSDDLPEGTALGMRGDMAQLVEVDDDQPKRISYAPFLWPLALLCVLAVAAVAGWVAA